METGLSRFDRLRRRAALVLGPASALVVYAAAPASLSPQARTLAAVTALAVVWWIGEPVPLPVTALLAAALNAALGVAPAKTVFAEFANPIIFLFLGSFILAQAMAVHGLDRRAALAVFSLRPLQESPARLIAAMAGVSAALSMWLSNTATAAMLLPIALGVLGAARDAARADGADLRLDSGPYAAGMLLAVAYGSTLGGLATPVGTPPNLIGMKLLADAGADISFSAWMRFGLPLSAILLAAAVFALVRLHPAPAARLRGVAAYVRAQRAQRGGWSAGERNVAAAFGLTVALWVVPNPLHPGVVAVLGACLLFVLPAGGKPTLTWKQAAAIDWGTVLLFGGGLSLGKLMFDTGLARWMGEGLASATGASSLWAITALAAATASALSETASNTASANMLIPIFIGLAQGAGVSPVLPALAATFGASLGFCLPVSTPPNAVVYGSGRVGIPQMVRAGLVLDAAAFVLLLGVLWIVSRLGWLPLI